MIGSNSFLAARYTSKEKTGVGVSAHHWGQVMAEKMEWDGRVIEWGKTILSFGERFPVHPKQ